jgi:hypothetical protein
MTEPQLRNVPGIGAVTAKRLNDIGIMSVVDLANAAAEDVSALPGFYPRRASAVIAAAGSLITALEVPGSPPPRQRPAAAAGKKGTKGGRGEGKKAKAKKTKDAKAKGKKAEGKKAKGKKAKGKKKKSKK